MGLKDKIKSALHNERDDEYSSTHNTTGTYDSSATHGTSAAHGTTGMNTTSGDYDPKYGSTNTTGLGRDHHTTGTSYGNTGISNDRHSNPVTGSSGLGRDHHTTGTSYDNSGITNDRHNNPVTGTGAGAGIGHRPTDSGVGLDNKHDKYDAAGNKQDPYWGSMGQAGRNSPPGTTTSHDLTDETQRDRLQRKDLPLRPNEQQSGVTSDIGGGRHGDVTSGIGGGRHGDMNRDTVSPTGGTYNTVAGAGSRDFDGRGNHTLNAVGLQNQSSGIRGSADDSYDSRLRDRDLGRDPKSGLGASGAGAGAGAGLTGAGLATRGNEFHERSNADSRDMGLGPSSQYQAGGGVPQSSMLDPYQTGPNTGRTGPGAGVDFAGDRTTDTRFGSDNVGGPGGSGAFNNSTTGAYGTTGPVHDSHMANKMDPRVDSDRDGSHTLGGAGRQGGLGHDERSGLGAGGMGATGMTTSGMGSSGMGPGHFGPGHDGSKVMHKCSGCGQDNDISHYFRKDAVYRMS